MDHALSGFLRQDGAFPCFAHATFRRCLPWEYLSTKITIGHKRCKMDMRFSLRFFHGWFLARPGGFLPAVLALCDLIGMRVTRTTRFATLEGGMLLPRNWLIPGGPPESSDHST